MFKLKVVSTKTTKISGSVFCDLITVWGFRYFWTRWSEIGPNSPGPAATKRQGSHRPGACWVYGQSNHRMWTTGMGNASGHVHCNQWECFVRVCKRENKSVLSKVLVYYCFLVFVICLCGRSPDCLPSIQTTSLHFWHQNLPHTFHKNKDL